MACGCITKVNSKLREQNAWLVTTLFEDPQRVLISTYKGVGKKRGEPPSIMASFCPFCGESYDITTEARKEATNAV